MIKLTLITLGKLKEKYLVSACDEYKKRLSRYCDLKVEEISPVYLPDDPSASEIEAALDREAELISKRIPEGAFTVSLCVEGKELSSEQLAQLLKERMSEGRHICLIIGSSYGLSEKIKLKSHLRLSVSKMTFPHQLFRVMLLEQIYRAFKINEGGTYHK